MMMRNKCEVALAPAAFLASVGLGRRIVELEPNDSFFTQGDPADSVFCLQQGRAKVRVVSEKGKQATITLLIPGDFFGEESLTTAPGLRMSTAMAVNRCSAFKIKREEMIQVLHQEHEFSDQFLSYLLARGMRTQADLVDQIFNSSEKRLARVLLLMAEDGKPEEPQALIPPITQETLAEMVGTTRSRVSFFMNRFRDLGLISYKNRIRVHRPRMQAVLLDQFAEG
ncbi:MAG TPA: Crp/Fnr family transcriptional regulator [Terracidiphilus sp.]|jgi:CRP-like cAMP-binding protein|nr:Crp/Fnr family transcriptional regulator [Terracidiphilus sp.]